MRRFPAYPHLTSVNHARTGQGFDHAAIQRRRKDTCSIGASVSGGQWCSATDLLWRAIPNGRENEARAFYQDTLGIPEVAKPASRQARRVLV
jgi:hypothetical protein